MTTIVNPTVGQPPPAKKHTWVLPVSVVTVLVVGILAGFTIFSGGKTDSASAKAPNITTSAWAPTSTASASTDALDQQAIIDLLTVKTASPDSVCKTDEYKLVGWKIGSLENIPPRMWSDAISTPFNATDPEGIRNELQQAICQDPLLGVSWAQFFATNVPGLTAVNEWLKPFAIDPAQINVLASSYVPLLDVANPTPAQVTTAIAKNTEWQQTASFINTLFDKAAQLEVKALPSVKNLHLAVGGMVVGTLPAVELNPDQENLPALVLTYTAKDVCKPLLTIGINVADKRPELFESKVCTTPATPAPTTSQTPTTPPTTHTTPPTTTPSCPPGQHGTPPICKDDPSKQVLNNPAVPAQVKGPGTTTVGTDPGPATTTIDSGTGLAPSTSSPSPSPTPTKSVPSQVQNPEPVLPAPLPTQTQVPIKDANGDGIPD